MRIRSELNSFSQSIASIAEKWEGTESIHITVPIKQKIRQIDTVHDMCQTLHQRIEQFVKKDQSLLGKIETLDQLTSCLRTITNKSHSLKPWYARILSYLGFFITAPEKEIYNVKARVDAHLAACRSEKRDVAYGGSFLWRIFDVAIEGTFLKAAQMNCDTPQKRMVQDAFRVVKGLNSLDLQQLDPSFSGASYSEAVRGIREDFVAFYTTTPAGIQKKLAPYLRSLDLAQKIANHLTVSGSLLVAKGESPLLLSDDQIDHYIRRQTADIAYEIEKAIKALPVGESIVIPGGFSKKGSGHAVATMVKKVDDQHVAISCYNTGLGSETAQALSGILLKLYKWRVEIPTFEQVPIRTAVKQAMLINLLDQSPTDWQPVLKVRKFMQEAMQKGKSPGQETKKDSIELQTWGTCSFDSIMSYLSHDLPAGLFLILQLYMMKKAHANIQAGLPQAQQEAFFNEYTTNLLKVNPAKSIANHRELCNDFFKMFVEIEKQLPKTQEALKAKLTSLRDNLEELQKEEKDYAVSFFAWGRPGLQKLKDTIAKEKQVVSTVRTLIQLAAPPNQAEEILAKSDNQLFEHLLKADLSFVTKYLTEMNELYMLFKTL